jgi:hypothetical protein
MFGWEAWTRTRMSRVRVCHATNCITSQPMGDNKKAVRRSGRPASTLTAREPFVNRAVRVPACSVPIQMAENIRCTDPGSACIELIDVDQGCCRNCQHLPGCQRVDTSQHQRQKKSCINGFLSGIWPDRQMVRQLPS